MNVITLSEIEAAVIRAKRQAKDENVGVENLDAVAAARVVLELLGAGNKEANPTHDPIRAKLEATFGEWARSYDTSTHHNRFIVATTYLLMHKDIVAVDTNDIMKMYTEARWPKPQNPADVFTKGAAKLHFAESTAENGSDNGLKKWRITQTGFDYFESLEQGE